MNKYQIKYPNNNMVWDNISRTTKTLLSGGTGAPILAAGEILGKISIGIDTGLKMLDGNYSGAAINVGAFGLGNLQMKGVKALGVTGIDAKRLNGGLLLKTDGVTRGGNYLNDRYNPNKKK